MRIGLSLSSEMTKYSVICLHAKPETLDHISQAHKVPESLKKVKYTRHYCSYISPLYKSTILIIFPVEIMFKILLRLCLSPSSTCLKLLNDVYLLNVCLGYSDELNKT